MRKIAMRCTQEQFDSIKDRIKLKNIDVDFDLKKYPYLTNYYSNIEYYLGSFYESYFNSNYEIYETFDAEIFLKACDSWEDEKVLNISDFEFYNENKKVWQDINIIDCKVRLKPKPDYSKEIKALQLKAKDNGMKCIINFEKI